MVQVFMIKHCCSSLNFFVSSTIQRLVNNWLGQNLVCVVYTRSAWIRGWVVFGKQGASTILTASAFLAGILGYVVQWECTYLGEIRSELVTMVRTFFPTLNFVLFF
ncbi:hypothetical protein Hanom_Chr01g00029281 [Helianthus anomalus]